MNFEFGWKMSRNWDLKTKKKSLPKFRFCYWKVGLDELEFSIAKLLGGEKKEMYIFISFFFRKKFKEIKIIFLVKYYHLSQND